MFYTALIEYRAHLATFRVPLGYSVMTAIIRSMTSADCAARNIKRNHTLVPVALVALRCCLLRANATAPQSQSSIKDDYNTYTCNGKRLRTTRITEEDKIDENDRYEIEDNEDS